MTPEEKEKIVVMRNTGIGYLKIAKTLGVNENSVRSFCRRNGLTGMIEKPHEVVIPGVVHKICKNCGSPFVQYPGHREKMFCCDACRIKWWNSHLSEVKRKAMYELICPTCGKTFYAYGNRNRKYCCHACYIEGRYGVSACG